MKTGLVYTDGRQAEVPLKGVKITGNVCGFHGEFQIVQLYQNSTSSSIEVVYTFPLPDKAIVTDFTARIGDRKITSEVWEKDKAFKIYDNALRKGDSSFLLEEFRPNLFQVSLGQLLPGEEVEIFISYLDDVKYQDGEVRILIPTLVAPRYIPGVPFGKRRGTGSADSTNQVPDADFITPPLDHVDYKVQLDLLIEPLINIEEVTSPSHEITVTPLKGKKTSIGFTRGEVPLDRDIIITGKGAEETTAGASYYQNSDGEKFLYLNLLPELESCQVEERPQNYIFLIDISGSMMGEKLEQAQNALQLCLRNLSQKDSFNLVAFESRTHLFSPKSIPFNDKNLAQATRWIKGLDSMGGTEIMEPLQFSLKNCSDEDTLLMLFTDGQVGNEKEIIRLVKNNIRGNRLFTFGIDTAVNSYFINSLAEKGSGLAEFIYPGERIEDKVLRQFSRITSPSVKDIKVDWGNLKVREVYPPLIKNIINLEPLNLVALVEGKLEGEITISGSSEKEDFHLSLPLSRAEKHYASNLLEKLWASFKITSLEEGLSDINPRREEAITEEIVKISREYKINSSHTSFVAVEEREDKVSGLPQTLVVPVSPPADWSYYQRDHLIMDSPVSTMGYFCLAEDDFNEDTGHLEKGAYSASKAASRGRQFIEKSWSGTEEGPLSNALRHLALKQQVDGSFADEPGEELCKRMKNTALSLLAFLLGSAEIRLYKKQLTKSVEFLTGYAEQSNLEERVKEEGEVKYLLAFTLKILENKKICRGKLKRKVELMLRDLTSSYDREKAPFLFQNNWKEEEIAREIFKTLNMEPVAPSREPGFEGEDMKVMDLSLLCLGLSCLSVVKGEK